MKIKYITISLLFMIVISCKKAADATSPVDLMFKLQTAIESKNAGVIENYLIVDYVRTPAMGKALSELIIQLRHPKQMPKSSGGIKFPKASALMIMNLTFCDFYELVNGEYDEKLEELRVKEIIEKSSMRVEIEHVVEVKETKDGFKFWPNGIENNAIIYTNEIYKRLPEVVSTDSITQMKNVNRLFELYVPKEDRIMEWK